MPASNATVKTPAKKAPVRRKRATATKSRKAAATPTPIVETAKVETPKVETSNPSKSIFDFKDLTSLRGLDLVVLPLIFLEAFTVNILQNAGFTVPARVAIK